MKFTRYDSCIIIMKHGWSCGVHQQSGGRNFGMLFSSLMVRGLAMRCSCLIKVGAVVSWGNGRPAVGIMGGTVDGLVLEKSWPYQFAIIVACWSMGIEFGATTSHQANQQPNRVVCSPDTMPKDNTHMPVDLSGTLWALLPSYQPQDCCFCHGFRWSSGISISSSCHVPHMGDSHWRAGWCNSWCCWRQRHACRGD